MENVNLYTGNSLEVLKGFKDNSIDSIVTDPPYGINFMNKKWDYSIPSIDIWKECLRVIKPGGHMLVACGTRTQHRMVCNIEDAGFEVRDIISWIYGSGFPKSLNIGKGVDKLLGNEREVIGSKRAMGTSNTQSLGKFNPVPILEETKGTSEYEGWGTGLKPAQEFWTLVRKPISEKTIVDNVIKWGTGGINIDKSRIPFKNENDLNYAKNATNRYQKTFNSGNKSFKNSCKEIISETSPLGRFPSNFIYTDDQEVMEIFEKEGVSKGNKPGSIRKGIYSGASFGTFKYENEESSRTGYNDIGNPSRFFYCAKVSSKERNMGLENKNTHPTLKPVNLMYYLCNLITPPNGIILDPFMGSGSTGISALLGNFKFVGIELDPEYLKISEQRIKSFELYREFIKK